MSQNDRPLTVKQMTVEQIAAAQYAPEPTAREVRAFMVQRLQVGLFGLALMLLLVGLANIIMQHAKRGDMVAGVVTTASTLASTNGSDPLADIGVVPAPDGGSERRQPATRNAAPR
jgi:hypothetical protein